MTCPRCRHSNPSDARFCSACGSELAPTCRACGHANASGSRFCNACGQSLGGPTPVASAGDGRATTTAERRQLTVMFCDLVGSTALSARLDPEEFRGVVRDYQTACTEVIARFDGHVAQYLGDGLLVYFGYPQAHEDDAARAVRTGLGIVEVIHTLNEQLASRREMPLAVRVGVHTGLVVVGDVGGGGKREQLALGETPNLAAHLQALAAPDTVVVSEATRRLVHGLFITRDLGPQPVKGSGTVRIHEVAGESSARSRLDASATTGLTRLVGRDQEVGLLLDRWGEVIEGRGQVVLLSGEAGIGKSRLVQVLKERLATAPHTCLECWCSPYHENTPIYPVIDLLPRLCGWSRDDSVESKLGKLTTQLTALGIPLAEAVPLFASLLSLPAGERYPLPPMSLERQRRRTLELLIRMCLAISTAAPLLLLVEDLHWADPSTLDLLTQLLDQTPTARLLVLLTARPLFQPPWTSRSHVTSLTLNRLGRRHTEVMINHVAGGKELPAEVIRQIATKTDGVPLFLEELTKMVLESGLLREGDERYELAGALPPLAIPATLHDSLMARLDRLSTLKGLAQTASILGREFSYDLLRAVSSLSDVTLQQELGHLVEAEFLYQRGLPPEATYSFKHALIQDAAYQSVLKSTRQQSHAHIAQVLEARFPEIRAAHPEVLAHHFTAAGLGERAIGYWQEAGERATQRSANVEAIRYFTAALDLLEVLPETRERTRRELALRLALGRSLESTKGWAANEVEHVYARARDLCRQVEDTPQLCNILGGLGGFYLNRGDLTTARELAEERLALAERLPDPELRAAAHSSLVPILYCGDKFLLSRAHSDRSVAIYEARRSRLSDAEGQSFVAALSVGANVLQILGHLDQARARLTEALTVAHERGHPFILTYAHFQAAYFHARAGDAQAARRHAEVLLAVAAEQGFAQRLAQGMILRGWALAQQGQGSEGIAEIRHGLAAERATGAKLGEPFFLTLLIDAHRSASQIEEGLGLVPEALAAGEAWGGVGTKPELHRLKGELLLSWPDASHRPEAEACLREALSIAGHQQAKLFELRAATSLARLWPAQDNREGAQRLLAGSYGWFTEGFDTLDLKRAAALLDELSASGPDDGRRGSNPGSADA